MDDLLFCQLSNNTAPSRATKGAVGIDITMPAAVSVQPHEIVVVDLALCVRLPSGHYGQLAVRSSIAKRGIVLLGGVIDADYTGSIKAVLYNCSNTTCEFQRNNRVVQLLCIKYATPTIVEASDNVWADIVATSVRKDGGFGSTGF